MMIVPAGMSRFSTVVVLCLAAAADASDVKRQRISADRIMRVEEAPSRQHRPHHTGGMESLSLVDDIGHDLGEAMASASGLVEDYRREAAKVASSPAMSSLTINSTSVGFPCHQPVYASDIPAGQNCSAECPFWAESALTDEPCTFRCVRDDECGVWGQGSQGNATVADSSGYCRRCYSSACNLCHSHEDRCVDCITGYTLTDEGACEHAYSNVRYFSFSLLAFLCVYIVLWYIELSLRPVVNEEGVKLGLAFRSRTKLRMPKVIQTEDAEGAPIEISAQGTAPVPDEQQETRPLWPLTTNLMMEPAGGPGTTLHFRFQMFWIIWPLIGCVTWAVIANCHNPDLLVLGLKEADSPKDLCRVVDWGHRVSLEAVNMKVAFCFGLYLITFLGSIFFAIKQQNYCQALDSHTTMADYAALLKGIPKLNGTVPVETQLTDLLRAETGQPVVGVSVCWDILEKGALMRDMLEADYEAVRRPEPDDAPAPPTTPADNAAPAEESQPPAAESATPEAPNIEVEPLNTQGRSLSPMEVNGWRWKFFGAIDRVFLTIVGVPNYWEKHKAPETMIAEMETTPYAWVVFGSEEARDLAVESFEQRNGVKWNDSLLELELIEKEPESVRWESISQPTSGQPQRIVKGTFHVLGALLGWCLLFYLPYAFYQSTFQYDANHQEPSGTEFTILGFVVTGGNAVLYLICAIVADEIHFHFEEQKESFYVAMYFMAVMVNVVLDVAVTGYISYLVMVNSGAHTWGGRPLGDLTTLQEVVESYPIQKTLGYLLFAYSMPATFLTPFLIEPVALTYLPYHLMCKIIRSNPYLQKWRAERAMSIFAPMDSGRYGDILVNASLAALILFVPAGWIVYIYGGMFVSHVYIYIFDHYRVLRCVPGFTFSDDTIDMFAWKMTSVVSAVILCAILLKLNCNSDSFGCVQGGWFCVMMLGAFFGHIVVHLFIFNKIVPHLTASQDNRATLKYEQVAPAVAANWFTVNPGYCFRSKYLYKHDPPVNLFVRGKEHLMKANPSAGSYFEDKPATPEKF
mmetsp:Transcript_78308/g.162676  ORF Transcript_78308/g.162676 Transcript_78308/m.162676 type:complete len:1029 (+) Transcript_78308:93-3179(+)